MTNKLEGFDESAIEVFQIAEAYAKENMNAAIEPAHILKALLHKDIGLVSFIEKTLDADYYYILEWADMRIKMSKKSSDSSMKSFSALTKAVVSEADSIRANSKKESIDPISLLIAVVTPGVGFTFEQLKTLPLQKESIAAAYGSQNGKIAPPSNIETKKHSKSSGGKSIEAYCILKNQQQADGKLYESIGFEDELGEIYGILGRKTKSNILITGESGVGKTALVNAFVQAITNGKVPTYLQNAQVYELDTIALSIGVSYKSEIEGRMKKILDELSDKDNAILVIESFDKLMDKQGTLNGTINLLKASLNQGLLCICTSSIEGFTKNIETDKEITGKFERIIIEEPSVEATDTILQTVVKSFAITITSCLVAMRPIISSSSSLRHIHVGLLGLE